MASYFVSGKFLKYRKYNVCMQWWMQQKNSRAFRVTLQVFLEAKWYWMQQELQFNIRSPGLSDLEESVSDDQTTVENEYSKDNIDQASI